MIGTQRKVNRMNDDLISRQAAIDALNGEFTITGRENAETIRNYINGVNKRLRELPSAERRGRWLPLEGDGYADGAIVYDVWECSNCGNEERGEDVPETNRYCRLCGARMEEEA